MTKIAIALSSAQLLILTTAAARADHAVMPLPIELRARGASRQRVVASVLRLTLAEEVPTDDYALSWRQDDDGQRYTLRLTKEGLVAVGGPVHEPSVLATVSEQGKICGFAAEQSVAAGPAVEQSASTFADSKAPGGKLGQILTAIGSARGATIEELIGMTGWLPHTTRAALTRLKQRGHPVQLVKKPDRKAYHLIMTAGA
jgi:hypothetical protein